jgi:tRNA (mo5U34)-methyltransferase
MSASSLAQNPEFRDRTQQQVDQLSKRGCYHSLELADGTVIPGLIGIDALKARIRSFPIPEDLRGQRVLDVGAASGWNSFEMERRGADVVAVDCVEFEEFHMARKLLGSKVDYRILDVDELTPQSIGRFDYVLFFGVLYHLRHPLLGLERICALTREAAFVESFVTDAGPDPAAPCTLEFYETNELGGQIDNWCGPNTNCLMALCRSAGFARVVFEHKTDRRAGVTCYRKFEPPPASPSAEPPRIHAAVNNRTNSTWFNPAKDEYICLYFTSTQPDLTRDQMRVEMDGYGVPVLLLTATGRDGWQANLKLPPFLDTGVHQVRVRTTASAFSNQFQIVAGGPAESQETRFQAAAVASERSPEIYAVENNVTGTTQFRGYKNEYLCTWFRSAEQDLKRHDVLVQVDGLDAPVLFLTDVGGGRWQTNSRLPSELAPGTHRVRVRTARSPVSNVFEIRFDPDEPATYR